MALWTRQPQEHQGTYQFNGKLYVTTRVTTEISSEEIKSILYDLQIFVIQNNGADYLQAYHSDDGRRIWIIDQLNKEMIESGEYDPDFNYYTVLFPEEY